MEPTNATASVEVSQASVSATKTDAVINDLRLNPEWMITLLLAFFLGVI